LCTFTPNHTTYTEQQQQQQQIALCRHRAY
jgi:hypothetical protein